MGYNRGHGLMKYYVTNGKEFGTVKELAKHLNVTETQARYMAKKGVTKDGTLIRTKAREMR